MGYLSEVGVLEKAAHLLSPCVSPRSSSLDVRESADRLEPSVQLVYGSGRSEGVLAI